MRSTTSLSRPLLSSREIWSIWILVFPVSSPFSFHEWFSLIIISNALTWVFLVAMSLGSFLSCSLLIVDSRCFRLKITTPRNSLEHPYNLVNNQKHPVRIHQSRNCYCQGHLHDESHLIPGHIQVVKHCSKLWIAISKENKNLVDQPPQQESQKA